MFTTSVLGFAQTAPVTDADKAAQYTKTITDRANKIVAKLGITDAAKYKRVLDAVVNQYRTINDIHELRNAQVADIKKQAGDDKAAAAAKIKAADDELASKTDKLHADYLARLNADLTAEQVDKVKDEMTYNVLSVTYRGYTEEVLTLTEAQKAQIKAWLIEAREHAMDAESSNKKHEVFGKYKGRINNYLSKEGYDMKKEGEEWQKRIKESSGKN
ncbi:uncharacterized protein DUF3826 [Mucilaginibacter gracilis]|uniref:Uncharacterized protein DUF3826 n=2 Tax=Mucilaginibacter gracilis TaxID=423350 RepID=A0A495J6W5_9SPHI|nr:uncharacterized protein DUF3826 [Mucilaginibacter gracilis]